MADHASARAAEPGVTADAWVVCYPARHNEPPPRGLQCASAERLHVYFAGHLFEPADLAARLALPAAAADDPARLALEAYRQLGEGWLGALAGHYAIIVDDRANGRLLAARDAMGLFPLFFAESGGSLLFSWSTDALLAQPGVSRALNRVTLAEHLVHRWSDPIETYFAAVRRIPPGHVLELDAAGQRIRRHWDPAAKRPIQWLRDDEVDLFDRALERAVARSVAGRRAAIFLSGGLDSISIAAVAVEAARRARGSAPLALSLGFPDPACNEEFIQRGVAQSLGMPQDFLPFDAAVSKRGFLQQAVDVSASWPVPMTNLWNPAYMELGRRGRERGCTVIMTGNGGDEWLSVSPYLSADLIRAGDVAGLVRLIGVLQRSFRISRYEAVQSACWTFGLRPLAGMAIDRVAPERWRARRRRKAIASTPAWLAPDASLKKIVDDRADRVLAPPQPPVGGFYEHHMRTAIDSPLMAMEAEESFEFGRRLGVSMAHPYWDSDLVALLYRTPPSLLTKGGRSKGLVRKSIARRFPDLGFERQRKVLATGFYWSTLQREGPQAWAHVGKASALAELGIVNRSLLDDTIVKLFVGGPESYRIWNILHLDAWVRSRL